MAGQRLARVCTCAEPPSLTSWGPTSHSNLAPTLAGILMASDPPTHPPIHPAPPSHPSCPPTPAADSPDEKRPPGLGLWEALPAKDPIPIYHFKWHAGLLANMKDRLEWYRCVWGGMQGGKGEDE